MEDRFKKIWTESFDKLFEDMKIKDVEGYLKSPMSSSSEKPTRKEAARLGELRKLAEKHLLKMADMSYKSMPVIFLSYVHGIGSVPTFANLGLPSLEIYRRMDVAQFPVTLSHYRKSTYRGIQTRKEIIVKEGRLYKPPTKDEIRMGALEEIAFRYLESIEPKQARRI